jgi:tetratricopeptide (TPR) repeat protein
MTRTGWLLTLTCCVPPLIGLAAQAPQRGSSAAAPVADASGSSLDALFQQYQHGQFDAVHATLQGRASAFEGVASEVDPFVSRHRSPIAAAFLLEVAEAGYRAAAPGSEDVFDRASALALEFAPGSDFDRVWQLAALSLMEGRGAGTDFDSIGRLEDGVREATRHLSHIANRRLDPGTLALAAGIIREQAAWNGLLVIRTIGSSAATKTSEINLQEARHRVRRAVDLLRAAQQFPTVRAEATLRLAAMLAFEGEHAQALHVVADPTVLNLFATVETLTSESRLIYLSRFLRGHYLQARGELEGAASAYQSALDVIPDAPSARLALGTVLYAGGLDPDYDGMFPVVTAATPTALDPWATFRYGDYRLWASRLQALRDYVMREAGR